MDIKRNYQKELEQVLSTLTCKELTPSLLLHSCCAPCSSYVLEYLSSFFNITIFYYNPNISFEEEYYRRIEEQKRLILSLPTKNTIRFLQGRYDTERFYTLAKGYEADPEGGPRCFNCYELRLDETGRIAKEQGFDYFSTTLSISPHKNAAKLNEIGEAMSKKHQTPYLYSDFKKKNGYKRSIELSKEYDLYRQDYCGCAYSKAYTEKLNMQRNENLSE